MANRLETPRSPVYPTHVSEFERGLREPSLLVLLAYAEAANVWVEALIKDSVDLPGNLPSPIKHEGVRRAGALKGIRKG
jgi:transcriptional regulator with XRE-family HTH domain